MSRKPSVPFWQPITLGMDVYIYYPVSLTSNFRWNRERGHILIINYFLYNMIYFLLEIEVEIRGEQD